MNYKGPLYKGPFYVNRPRCEETELLGTRRPDAALCTTDPSTDPPFSRSLAEILGREPLTARCSGRFAVRTYGASILASILVLQLGLALDHMVSIGPASHLRSYGAP